MGVTNYFTVNGRITGEETNGITTDYATDALGSVSATVDSTGAKRNTYRYKPYGVTLAKTGTDADPRFLWTGETGSSPHSPDGRLQYNRARDYSVNFASWTTVDPLIQLNARSTYGYARSNPVRFLDPTGMLSINILLGPNYTHSCGGACVKFQWVLQGKEVDFNGWLIQHIVNTYDGSNCLDSSYAPPFLYCDPPDYFEAWRVKFGTFWGVDSTGKLVDTKGIDDSWSLVGTGPCTYGLQMKEGFAKLARGDEYPGTWYTRTDPKHNSCAGWLYSRPSDEMKGWSDNIGTTKNLLSTLYGCCCGPKLPTCPPGIYSDPPSCQFNKKPCEEYKLGSNCK